MTAKTTTSRVDKVRHSPMEHPRHQYPEETAALQQIAISCGLKEEIKWGKPCFTDEGKNIVLIQRFNEYVALMFFKGALLKDPQTLLSRIGDHMQAPRQLRFRNLVEVKSQEATVRAFIEEAVGLERVGAKVPIKKAADYAIPRELQTSLDANPDLKRAFTALSPGRQKGYIFQIAAAKQSATRAARVEKYTPRILSGKGIND